MVGPNGASKSTLFALLLGDVSPDKGTIAIEKNATIGFLPQETAAAGNETVLELALAVSPGLVHAQKVIKDYKHDHEHEADDVAYHNALHVFDEHGKDRGPTSGRALFLVTFLVTTVDSHGRTIFVADVHRGDGKRFILSVDEKLTAFLELEFAICSAVLIPILAACAWQFPQAVFPNG